MNSFYNLARSELGETLKAAGFETFRAAQLFKHVYQNNFDPKYLPASLRNWLGENLQVSPSATIESEQVSCDGTRKFLLSLAAASKFKVESNTDHEGCAQCSYSCL
jgi:adenine C2-methylase RlmN of 23S rRNA A2503 and tRNA A37